MRAEVLEESPHRDDVTHVRNVVESDGFRSENRRGHAGQSGILSAANCHPAFESISAADAKLVHVERLKEKLEKGEGKIVPLWLAFNHRSVTENHTGHKSSRSNERGGKMHQIDVSYGQMYSDRCRESDTARETQDLPETL